MHVVWKAGLDNYIYLVFWEERLQVQRFGPHIPARLLSSTKVGGYIWKRPIVA